MRENKNVLMQLGGAAGVVGEPCFVDLEPITNQFYVA